MSELVLIRHGQSEWNRENRFTGWVDCCLSDAGVEEARKAGTALAGREFDVLYTSELRRAIDTAELLLDEMDHADLETQRAWEINERFYGALTGRDKDEAREEFGEEQVHIWRRSYDIPPPGGESLEHTAERSVKYFEDEILPRVAAGESVLVSAHGNSLRAIVMAIEGLSREEVMGLELPTGEPRIYAWDGESLVRD